MKTKLLLGWGIILLLSLNIAQAITTYEETSYSKEPSAPAKRVLARFDDTEFNSALDDIFATICDVGRTSRTNCPLIERYFKKARLVFGNSAFEAATENIDDNILLAKGFDEIKKLHPQETDESALRLFKSMASEDDVYNVTSSPP